MKILRATLCHLLYCALLLVVTVVAQAAPVGEVVFSVGDVHVQGNEHAVVKGAKIEVGQTLVTGANGHVHIRFVDQAFVSLRPASQLRIDDYVWDAEAPRNNKVRFTLETGTSRLITGKAGQANKEGFRLNTPIAAIGIRGTDFIVYTTADNTRVAVQQGAIVLSPFGEDCPASGIGPCGGDLARQLSGSLVGNYLELKGRAQPPVLMTPLDGARNPNTVSPPRPEEPSVGTNGGSSESVAAQARTGTSLVWWGRWGSGVQNDVTAGPGREVIASSDLFVLMRSTENLNIPTSGKVNFVLADSEAYKRTADGVYKPAAVSNAALTVDFSKQKFATSLNFLQDGLVEQIKVQGNITSTGRFTTNPARSNASVSGALSGDGNEAIYYFQKYLAGQERAVGVVRWQR